MKLKQRMVVLCAILLLLGLAKIFLLDGGEGTAASRRDLRSFHKVRVQVANYCVRFVYICLWCITGEASKVGCTIVHT